MHKIYSLGNNKKILLIPLVVGSTDWFLNIENKKLKYKDSGGHRHEFSNLPLELVKLNKFIGTDRDIQDVTLKEYIPFIKQRDQLPIYKNYQTNKHSYFSVGDSFKSMVNCDEFKMIDRNIYQFLIFILDYNEILVSST